jgi:hypothetical protein
VGIVNTGDYIVKALVDPRVELLSVIFLLSGRPEYGRAQGEYPELVREYFHRWQESDVVIQAHQLSTVWDISFDAPMSLAVHLAEDGLVRLNASFSEVRRNSLDKRWQEETKTVEFIKALDRFTKESAFYSFIGEQRSRFEEIEERVSNALPKDSDLNWLDKFFGTSADRIIRVAIGMLADTNSYGPRVGIGDKPAYYSIVGFGMVDPEKKRNWSENLIHLVLHEVCHSYANPFVDRHSAGFEEVGQEIFKSASEEMTRQAYGNWKTVLCETIVRATTLQFHAEKEDEKVVERVVEYEKGRGFKWIPEMQKAFAHYQKNRAQYTTLDAFASEINSALWRYVANI